MSEVGRVGRAWAYRVGLHRSKLFVSLYGRLSSLQYRGAWDEAVTFRGHEFCIGEDRSLYPAVRRGWFEADELDALLPQVADDSIVWDVGANVGIYAVLLAKQASAGRVIAFEPVPDTRQRLIGNLERNAVSNVTVEDVALSSSDGSASMSVSDDSHGCDHISATGGGLTIRTARGDDYVAASPWGDPDVIKVDIEGHEPQFLAGCREMLVRKRPLLLMEVNPATWRTPEIRQSWTDALDMLFGLYGSAQWIGPTENRTLQSLDIETLGEEATSLMFR